MRDLISGDKQLWVNILKRELLEREIALPAYRRSLEDASASHVESWLRTGLQLERSYGSGHVATTVRWNVERCVTWARLIRGRWCLIASADTTES